MNEPRETGPIKSACCIVGGGPAGMMLGFLLARAGVEVAVLEKHGDFLRDFRGDTIHPSTLEFMYELGLLDAFLQKPHQKVTELSGQIGDTRVTIGDFTHLPTHCKFIALMPQWDFLNFLAEHGKRYPEFKLFMRAEAIAPIERDGRVIGVRANTAEGAREFHADLVVGADGRHSTMRSGSHFTVDDLGAPMDVLWFRLSRNDADETDTFGHIEAGHMLVMLNRGDYWQCAFVIAKGSLDALKSNGLPAFREQIAELSPFMRDRVGELKNWDDVKLLTVAVDRLRRWYRPGLLCIGDAAHAMSPIGGVGINLAVQDAVAAANILAAPLRSGTITTDRLHDVQQRRELPTRIIQRVQIAVQNNVISNVLKSTQRPTVPFAVKLLRWFPWLRRWPARLLGVGFRPEHVRTPDLH